VGQETERLESGARIDGIWRGKAKSTDVNLASTESVAVTDKRTDLPGAVEHEWT
jgi:hypothetical protein